MPVETTQSVEAGFQVTGVVPDIVVGEPLIVEAIITEPVGPLTYSETWSAELGKVGGVIEDNVEIFKTEKISRRSSLMTREMIPLSDLNSGAVIRRMLANAD